MQNNWNFHLSFYINKEDYSKSNTVLKSILIGEEAVKNKFVLLIDDMFNIVEL